MAFEVHITYQPTVSTVIINHNYGRFLGEAIDSALAQDYGETEVVVVDDGSTDGSREVIEAYAGRIVPVFQANGGQGAAFSAGYSASSGELVFPLDADDIFLPNRVSRVVEALSRLSKSAREDVSLVRSRMAFWEAPDIAAPLPALTGLRRSGPRKQPYSEVIHPPIAPERVLNARIISLVAGTALVREKAERFLPVPAAFRVGGSDAYWSAMAQIVGSVLDVPEILALYRVHDKNAFVRTAAAEKRDFHVHTETALYNHLLSLGYHPTMRFNAILDLRHASKATAERFPLRSPSTRLRHLLRATGPVARISLDILREYLWKRRDVRE